MNEENIVRKKRQRHNVLDSKTKVRAFLFFSKVKVTFGLHKNFFSNSDDAWKKKKVGVTVSRIPERVEKN